MLGRLAEKMRAIGIGDDQTSILWKKIAAQVLRESEEQPVAMGPVVLPFVIGAQIFDRRLDLDDPDLAALVQRHQIGATSRRQRQLADARKAERTQKPRRAARDRERRLGLAAVGGRHEADLAGGRFHYAILSDPARLRNNALPAPGIVTGTHRRPHRLSGHGTRLARSLSSFARPDGFAD